MTKPVEPAVCARIPPLVPPVKRRPAARPKRLDVELSPDEYALAKHLAKTRGETLRAVLRRGLLALSGNEDVRAWRRVG